MKMFRLSRLILLASLLLGATSWLELPVKQSRMKQSTTIDDSSDDDDYQYFVHPYIEELYENSTHSGNQLFKEDESTIWSFLDVDLVKEIRNPTHADLNSPMGTQTLINVFNWGALRNDIVASNVNLHKAILRVYKDSSATIDDCSKATLQAKVYCKHGRGETQISGSKITMNMSNGRKWEELDLTEPLKSLWPIPEGSHKLFVTVIVNSECDSNKFPIKLLNLKSIKDLRLRKTFYSEQPVMCIYISNKAVTKKPPKSTQNHSNISQKRYVRLENNYCRKVDHIVNFNEIRMEYVIAPQKYNAGRCVGRCNSNHLHDLTVKGNVLQSNNYARILAAQAYRRKDESLMICCSPQLYEPIMLLISTADGSSIKQKLFHDMKVKQCSCR